MENLVIYLTILCSLAWHPLYKSTVAITGYLDRTELLETHLHKAHFMKPIDYGPLKKNLDYI